jgi:1,2-phenylacetyl-CoA epoxidase PaaB subunit
MQQQDGSRWVSMDDFERGLQQVAEQVVGTLRTPQARTALGWS